MLLSTVPLAERMLLYHVAVTAWAMVPERGLWSDCFFAHAGCAQLEASLYFGICPHKSWCHISLVFREIWDSTNLNRFHSAEAAGRAPTETERDMLNLS